MSGRTGQHPVSGSRVVWRTELVIGAIVSAVVLVAAAYGYLETRFSATQEALQELRIQLAQDYATRAEVEELADTLSEVRRDVVRIWERVDSGHQ